VTLDPLVRRLGTPGNLRGGVSKSYESQSNESHQFEDDLGLFLTIKSRLWSIGDFNIITFQKIIKKIMNNVLINHL
jgi:hypothetical protein